MLAGLGFPPYLLRGRYLSPREHRSRGLWSIGIPVVTLWALRESPRCLSARWSARSAPSCLMRFLCTSSSVIGMLGGRARSGASCCGLSCGCAVLRFKLHRTGADRYPELADVHRRDGSRAEAIEKHLPPGGRRPCPRSPHREKYWSRGCVYFARHLRVDVGYAPIKTQTRQGHDVNPCAEPSQRDYPHATAQPSPYPAVFTLARPSIVFWPSWLRQFCSV